MKKKLVEYRCQGTRGGIPCGHLLARAEKDVPLEVKCNWCKTVNKFNQALENRP